MHQVLHMPGPQIQTVCVMKNFHFLLVIFIVDLAASRFINIDANIFGVGQETLFFDVKPHLSGRGTHPFFSFDYKSSNERSCYFRENLFVSILISILHNTGHGKFFCCLLYTGHVTLFFCSVAFHLAK